MKTLLLLLVSCFLIASCEDEKGIIIIQNKVHNTKLDEIRFEDTFIRSSLLSGETTNEVTITDKKESFPKNNQLQFYMENNGKRVYLKTKDSYQLDAGKTLLIIIYDSTKVINPLLE
jgi:hypothetical protein